MDKDNVEGVAISLIREFLSRKAMKRTLDMLDEERPQGSGGVSSRVELARILNLDNLIQKNNDSGGHLRTFLEMMAANLMGQSMKQDGLLLDRATTSRSKRRVSKATDDMVLSDTVDGETVVGGGRNSLVGKRDSIVPTLSNVGGGRARGSSGAGPIMPSVERDRGKVRYGRQEPEQTPSKRGSIVPTAPTAESTNPTSQLAAAPITSTLRFERQDSAKSRQAPPLTSTMSEATAGANGSNSGGGVGGGGSVLFDSDTKFVKNRKEEDALDFEAALSKLAKKSTAGRRSKSKAEDLGAGYEYNVAQSSISTTGPAARSSKSGCKDIDRDLAEEEGNESEPSITDLAQQAPGLLKQTAPTVPSEPINKDTAAALKTLIFGSGNHNFKAEWKLQSFTFCDLPKLQYGIVQKKGGPCGVLASVQAAMLQELFFHGKKQEATVSRLEPSRAERSAALARGLAKIFWRAAEETEVAKVALPSKRSHYHPSSRCKEDGLTETLTIYSINNLEDLRAFMQFNVGYFEADGNSGVILALYSAILSRTTPSIHTDMDQSTNTLMGAHGYCTQEMVNLLLTGQAASNVFNDVMHLDSGGSGTTTLKGIHARSDLGLLSLYEHFKSCQVGTYYKTPKFPIWVVCSESHFSVLFCLKKQLLNDWKAEKHFDLYYYDGLARQESEIRLSIDTTNKFYKALEEDELVPPLEHCIRTKWRDAEIDWNGAEPLL